MTRSWLAALGLLVAGASALGASALLGVSAWWGLPVVPLTWFGLSAAARAAHRAWIARRMEREARRLPEGEGRSGPVLTVLGLAARFHASAAGESGFTREAGPVPALERAVLTPWPPGDEAAVLGDLARSTPTSRAVIARALGRLQAMTVGALSRPLHPLFPEAHRMLGVMGYPPPLVLGRLRAEAAWHRRRRFLEQAAAEEILASRLLRGGMIRAAEAALDLGPGGVRSTRIRGLTRFVALLARGDRRGELVRPEEFADHGPELVLLTGRSLRELVPGSPLLGAVHGGAAALERAVCDGGERVAGLVALEREVPDLTPLVVAVLTRLLGPSEAKVRRALRRRRLSARPDLLLQAHLRGLALLEEGRPREAAGEFEKVVRGSGPLALQAAYALACSHRTLGDEVAGEEVLQERVEVAGDEPDAHLLLARYLTDGGDDDAARAAYEEAVTRFPGSTALRIAFAQDLLEWGDSAAARRHLDAAHKSNPDDPRLALLAGRARVTSGLADEAVEPLERASRRLEGGEQAEAEFWLLAAYRDQGFHDRALALADGLVERLGAGQVGFLDELAEYLEERHEYVRARRAEERARRFRGGW